MTRERLQPALLDRLTDDDRAHTSETDDARVMSKAQLRAAVVRDLGWLFNAVQPLAGRIDAQPALAGTVLNFGLPPLAGQLASKIDVSRLERHIRDAIRAYEPRILPHTLEVHALEATSVLDTHNIIEFRITGHLWAQPVPLEILLRTQIDLEAGQVQVRDGAPRAPADPLPAHGAREQLR